MTARLAMSAVLLLLMWSGTSAARGAVAPAQETVVLLGSSSVGGHLGHALVRELWTVGVEVVLRRRSSTGLARPDFYDWPRSVRRGPSLGGHLGVMVLLGGNDTQPLRLMRGRRRAGTVRWEHEAEWRVAYAELVQTFGRELCERGARRVVWLLPPNPGRGAWSEKLGRVRAAQREGARAIQCVVDVPTVVIDGDAPAAPFGRGESSDGIHLNRAGARRYWDQVGVEITRALGISQREQPAEPRDDE